MRSPVDRDANQRHQPATAADTKAGSTRRPVSATASTVASEEPAKGTRANGSAGCIPGYPGYATRKPNHAATVVTAAAAAAGTAAAFPGTPDPEARHRREHDQVQDRQLLPGREALVSHPICQGDRERTGYHNPRRAGQMASGLAEPVDRSHHALSVRDASARATTAGNRRLGSRSSGRGKRSDRSCRLAAK